MTIDPQSAVFPNNVVILAAMTLESLDSTIAVFRRPLRMTDPNLSIGVYAKDWSPVQSSMEIQGIHPGEPLLQNYGLEVCVGIKDTEEERGLAVSSIVSSRARAMLVRNPSLQVVLRQLQVVDLGMRETVQKWGVSRQEFVSAEYQRTFYYLSMISLFVQTSTVPTPI